MYKNFLNLLLIFVFLCGNSIGGERKKEGMSQVEDQSKDEKLPSKWRRIMKICLIGGVSMLVVRIIYHSVVIHNESKSCAAVLNEIRRDSTWTSSASIKGIRNDLSSESKAFIEKNPKLFTFLGDDTDIDGGHVKSSVLMSNFEQAIVADPGCALSVGEIITFLMKTDYFDRNPDVGRFQATCKV